MLTIDLSYLYYLSIQSPFFILWVLFKNGGWVIFLFIFLWGFKEIWLFNLQRKYLRSIEYIILAIDIPKANEQSAKAMEYFFTQLAGTFSRPNLKEKYFQGKTQLSFSFEIISLDGYIQFLIYTPKSFRDLVEAAIYAQYPEAEITEVKDYIKIIPEDFPHQN